MSSSERCVRHIITNFPMFGFGNAEAAILQTAKELLENSMDALKERGLFEIDRGMIQINITGSAL